MSNRRRRRKEGRLAEGLVGLIFLAVFATSSTLLAWFNQRPWAIPMAIIIVVTIFLGLTAFLITLQRMRQEEQRRRLVAEHNWLSLSHSQFEEYVAELFRVQGWRAKVTGGVADGGVDIRIEKDGARAIAQCKRYRAGSKVNVKEIREFSSVLSRSGAAEGYFVTTSSFTGPALDWARKEPITLASGNDLAQWMKEAKFGPYTEAMPRPPLFFTAGQWLTLTLLGVAVIGVSAFLAGLLAWG